MNCQSSVLHRQVNYLFCTLVLAVCVVSVSAKSVSVDTARQAALAWLKLDSQPLGARMTSPIKAIKSYSSNGEIQFYVVRLSLGGFVIVSADDLVEPIIAFSAQGDFTPGDGGPISDLATRDIANRILEAKQVQKTSGKPMLKAHQQKAYSKWQRLVSSAMKPLADSTLGITSVSDLRRPPLLGSRWNQMSIYTSQGYTPCYNYYTPKNYPCGCLATACAQLLRYHQYPSKSVGPQTFVIAVDGTTMTRSLRGGDGLGGPYDWNHMTLDPGLDVTTPECQAIGALTADVGTAFRMSYTASGSAAGMSPYPLCNVFGFQNCLCLSSASHTTGSVPLGLFSTIKANLDGQRPVLLCISSSYVNSHAVVCDGYGYNSDTLYHHLNLGWGGDQDAWYALPAVGAYYGFNVVQECFYNVFPKDEGEIISGRVIDEKGNPVSGTIVTATLAGGRSWKTSTDNSGVYAFVGLPSLSEFQISLNSSTQCLLTGYSENFNQFSGDVSDADFPAKKSPLIPFATAVNNNSLIFNRSGNSAWFGQTDYSHDGSGAGRSGQLVRRSWTNYNNSDLETTVTGPGTISFWWACSCAVSPKAYLAFIMDDNLWLNYASGETAWNQQSFTIPAGKHKLSWSYRTYDWTPVGSDCGWIDQVTWVKATPIPTVTPTPTPTPQPISLADALNPSLTWTCSGVAWTGERSTSHDGVEAAQSGTVGTMDSSTLQTTVVGPGNVSFWWKISSPASQGGSLYFHLDGQSLGSIAGDKTWAKASFDVPAGSHTLEWIYYQLKTDAAYSNCAWVDEVVYTKLTPTPTPTPTTKPTPRPTAVQIDWSLLE